jgi:hypothetical protein
MKLGAKVIRHRRYVPFHSPRSWRRDIFVEYLSLIAC